MTLSEARLAGATALLRINQQRRILAEATLITAVVLSALIAVVAIATRQSSVILALPAATLLLQALSFEYYSEVTVTGAARRGLEDLLNIDAGGPGLIYETYVAEVRKKMPLVRGVRARQLVARLLTVAGIVVATVLAAGKPSWAIIAYVGLTLFTAGACFAAYRDMVRAAAIGALRFPEAESDAS